MTLAIEVADVRKTYRDLVALQGLDLQVGAGDVFGFIGPNGAGKSTTIKILTGLVRPTSGGASIFGAPAGTVEARRHLGYLPEVPSYHEIMTVGELLRFHARLAGMASADVGPACAAALEAVALSHRERSRIRELSKGMQQRFGIAQALVARPRLLILDEPTSGLDPLSQKEIKDIIVTLKAQGITIFFSSHQLTEVELICDRIGILHRGRLLRCCPLEDLLTVDDRVAVGFRGSGNVVETLRAEGYEAADGTLVVAADGVDAALDALHSRGCSVLSVAPHRRTLEDAFFELVSGA